MSAIRDLGGFTGAGYDRGRSVGWQLAWLILAGVINQWFVPVKIRVGILRAFGASIGNNVNLRHGVKIHWPWKLAIGDNSWVGERAWILNLEPVTIGENVCISQEVLLCTGSHDRKSRTFEFDNGPIVIKDGAWVAARATVLRGSVIGRNAVVGATALVGGDVPPDAVVLAPLASEPSASPRPDGKVR